MERDEKLVVYRFDVYGYVEVRGVRNLEEAKKKLKNDFGNDKVFTTHEEQKKDEKEASIFSFCVPIVSDRTIQTYEE